jgi:glutathione-regulated potassium-efflux system ancillary protein KefC
MRRSSSACWWSEGRRDLQRGAADAAAGAGPAGFACCRRAGEFAFVVFRAAAGSQVLSETASLLIGSAVAISMLLNPLLLVAIDRLLMPALHGRSRPRHGEMSEPQRIFAHHHRRLRPASTARSSGRLLNVQTVAATVLDPRRHDMIGSCSLVSATRSRGDASRLDLLLPGIAEARCW